MSSALKPRFESDENRRTRVSHYLWFIGRESTLHGPFMHDQLLKLLASGEFEPGDYCWRQGFNEWRSICGVDDFGFSKKPYIVKDYPLIPAPSSNSLPAKEPETNTSTYSKELLKRKASNYFDQIQETKPVRVRLERQGRFEMGLWERTGMILFAFALAWGASWITSSEIATHFKDQLEKRVVGSGVRLGHSPAFHNESSYSLYALAPMLSAVGLKDSEELFNVKGSFQQKIQNENDTDTVPYLNKSSSHRYEWVGQLPFAHRFSHKADPIYIESYEFHGKWRPNKPDTIRITLAGYPEF